MDRNEARRLLYKNIPKLAEYELDWVIDWLYANNYEIVDRSLPEKDIEKIRKEKKKKEFMEFYEVISKAGVNNEKE